MELTLKRLLEHAEFKKYRGKGYDPAEVDDFLDKAAAMAGKVEVQLTQALEQARSGGASAPSSADIDAEVERRVAAKLAEQPAPSSIPTPSEEEVAEEARRTLTLAQRTADAAVKEAREDAERLLTQAREEAASAVGEANDRAAAVRAEADEYAASVRADADAHASSTRADVEAEATRERREARQRLSSEIAELEGTRESLRSDVNILERHVEEQRSQLGSTLAELQQILDDPSGFRMAPVPALADPTLPDFSDLDQDEPSVAASPEPEAAAGASEPGELADDPTPAIGDATDLAPSAEVPSPTDPVEPAAAESVAEAGDTGLFGRVPPPLDDAVEDPPAPPAFAFDDVDHEAPGILDPGPPTAPVSAVDLEEDGDDDPFLAELRKAISDDEPLGPRDDLPPAAPDALFGDEDDRRGWRFGRRH